MGNYVNLSCFHYKHTKDFREKINVCVLQKVKIIDDRSIFIKLSKKPLFFISKQYFSGSMRAFIRIYI
jgi:hypothetical protein